MGGLLRRVLFVFKELVFAILVEAIVGLEKDCERPE